MLIFYALANIKKPQIFNVSGCTKGNTSPKWVKQQQQYRREQHNLMLLTWNASASTVKQNACKNKTV